MITREQMYEILYHQKMREISLSDEYFYALPFEIQKAIIMSGYSEKYDRRQKIANFQKRMALEQYNFEEKVKDKVLKLLKRAK